MATLQKLRTNAGVFLAVVIFIALAAFILGDLLKSGSSFIRGKQMEIAQIDGESMEYGEFQARFDQVADIYKSNNNVNNLDENAYQQILNQTWDLIVQEKIMGKVYNDLSIDVTSDELFDMVQGNNLHPIMQQLFGNQETGQVDRSAIIRFLKYIQTTKDAPQRAYWLNVEKQIVSSTKQTKYNSLVAKGLYVNSLQAKQSIAEKSKSADLKYIMKKYTDVSDSLFKISESEMKEYYNTKKETYKQVAQRNIAYVVFDIRPSAEDDRETKKIITELKPDFEKATDNVQFVNINSDTRFEDVFSSEAELTPELSAWAFNAEEGAVYGPYKESSTYKMAKLNTIKMLPDSVKASHILLRAQNAQEVATAQAKIDSIKTAIESGKITFEIAAKDNSQDGSATEGGDLGWFKKGMMVAPFEKAAFRSEKGELVSVVTQFGVHLIKVTNQSKKSKHVQLAIVDRQVSASTTTYQKTYGEASKFAANAQDLSGFDGLVVEQKLNKRVASVGENDRNITGLVGATRNLIRAAFINSKPGELIVGNDKSPIFELDNKFIVAALVSAQEDGIKSFESVRPSIQNDLLKKHKKEYLSEQFKKAKGADIDQTATKLGILVDQAENISLNYGSVSKIGYEPAIDGAALALSVNKQSNPIVGRNGVYIIEVTKFNETPAGDVNAEKIALFNSSSYRANYQAYNTLKEETEIVDSRSKFY